MPVSTKGAPASLKNMGLKQSGWLSWLSPAQGAPASLKNMGLKRLWMGSLPQHIAGRTGIPEEHEIETRMAMIHHDSLGLGAPASLKNMGLKLDCICEASPNAGAPASLKNMGLVPRECTCVR